MKNIMYCNLYRTCITCGIQKYGSEFHNDKKECKKCIIRKLNLDEQIKIIDKKLQRIKRWAERDIGLECINKNKNIYLFVTDLSFAKQIGYEEAVYYYKRGRATVYNQNELYLHGAENKFLSKKIIIESEFTCYYCGNYGDTIDHLIPKSKGGRWTEDNLKCCCNRCNNLKGDMENWEYEKAIGNLIYKDYRPIKRVYSEKKREILRYNKNGIPIYK